MTRRPRLLPLALAGALVLSACSSAGADPDPAGTSSSAATTAPDGVVRTPGTAVLAFAGDVHFEGSSSSTTDLGSAFEVLASADLSVVNLETAVTTGGTRADKQFTFRAPPRAMTALEEAGVDAVSVANNHGVDYGATGLQDTLAAGRAAALPVLGAGDDVDDAFRPLRLEPQGVPVSVIAATDVLDTSLQTAWTATATRPGLASTKDSDRLLADVRTEARAGRVVVVFLHWGTEQVQCPTARQRSLAADLAEAGASVVVGSHAHALQPTGQVGTTLVAYGLGNFHFYAQSGSTLGTQTGVLTVEVSRDGVQGSQWHPAVIRSGRPELLTGAARTSGGRSPDELAQLGRDCAAGTLPTAPSQGAGGQGDAGAGSDDGSGASASPSGSPSPSASASATAGAAPSSGAPSEPAASPSASATATS